MWSSWRHSLLLNVVQLEALSHCQNWPINGKEPTVQPVRFERSLLPSAVYIFSHLPSFQRTFMTHDALRTTPPTVRNSTAVRKTAAVPECLQSRRQVVATRRRNSKYRAARLCMAAGWPMARQSGYSKYLEGVQRLLHDLWVELLCIVHTLTEVRGQMTASDAMSQCVDGTCLGLQQITHCEILCSNDFLC